MRWDFCVTWNICTHLYYVALAPVNPTSDNSSPSATVPIDSSITIAQPHHRPSSYLTRKEPPPDSPIGLFTWRDPSITAIQTVSIDAPERDGCRRINVETKASESGHHHLGPTYGLQMTMVGSMDTGYPAHAHHRGSLSCESATTSARNLTCRMVEEQYTQLPDLPPPES